MSVSLDPASERRLVLMIVAHEAALLGRALTDYEVTWALNQESAVVADVARILDALVAEGVLVRHRDAYDLPPVGRRDN